MNSNSPVRWKRQTLAILLFGISFGYVEAAVVTYLRPQFDAVRATFTPPSRDLFPLLSPQQVRAAGPDMVRLVGTELAREAATLLMLGAVAVAVGGNLRQWLAFFLLVFGAWDISYYAFSEGFDRLAEVAARLGRLISYPRAVVCTRARPCLGGARDGRNGARLSVAGSKRSFDSAEGSSLARCLRGRIVDPGRLYLGLPQRHGGRDAEALPLAPICSR